jgi:hypothetical protein
MSDEVKVCNHPLFYEDLSAMLAVVRAIPDGLRLATFPSHCEGAECWCRPRVVFEVGTIRVNHKDLLKGDFDC